ncbi:Proto-oncogene Mas, partial [Ophiophagus hannah]
MVVSTVTLLIHMRSKSQRNQRKLLTTIFLALLFFLLLSLPLNVFYVIDYFDTYNLLLMTIGLGCATLNSSINPLLYFLVGRKKRGKDQPRASYKVALQRVLKDEKGSLEEQETSKMQRNQRKLLTALLLALLFYLLFSLPMNVFYVIEYFATYNLLLMTIGIGCAILNSSINPLLYFLVGRKKRGKDQPRASYKVALQRVFKDEKGSLEQQETVKEDQL